MNLKELPIGKNAPNVVNCVIEIPKESNVKYEYDPELGVFYMDRILQSAMRYPANYGFIPSTLAEDGDPLDVLVYNWTPLITGSVLTCEVIGVLDMNDGGEKDWKILARPTKSHKNGITDVNNVNGPFLDVAKNFFQHYKDLEKKVVEIGEWLPKDKAVDIVAECVERYKQNQ